MARSNQTDYVRLIGIPILGIMLAFLFTIGSTPTLTRILRATTFTLVFWQGLLYLVKFYRNKFPLIKQVKRRLFFTLISGAIYVVVADFTLNYAFRIFFPDVTRAPVTLLGKLVRLFFIPALIGFAYELTYLFGRWNITTAEAEKLRNDQTVAQLESLKNQVSPHFLFNSLNTLVALIPENQQQAVDFTQKLSAVYRYILEYKEKELVSLRTELDFINSYVDLLKMRYPENLTVEFSINEDHWDYLVAPLSIQMLVENALKHNIISKNQPLQIDVYTQKGDSVIVRNTLQLKNTVRDSTQTGLENIRRRYQFLTNKTIDVITTQTNFMVVIPLIKTIRS
ncbi:MAG: histidine kinase [Bacteroidia bacterium]|nr:histidine kinase [Bacteroidia bacterium]